MSVRIFSGFALCGLIVGCAATPAPATESEAQPAPALSAPAVATVELQETGSPPDAGPPPLFASDPLLEHCGQRVSLSSPDSIAAVVAAINAQPKPLTLGCFLRSLKRPLKMQASLSVFSAQPAVGTRSPRLFIFNNNLVLTLGLAGAGVPLLEMGEFVTETRSLKAELHFPISEQITEAAPYERILTAEGTPCRGCHADEQESPLFAGAFISDALRPAARDVVSIDGLVPEALACDVYAEAERCALLHGLFAYGVVAPQEFPEVVRIFH